MGALDAEGIFIYDDTEPVSPLDDYINLLANSTSATVADIRAAIAAITALVDSNWTNITTFGTGWTATVNHQPRVRKVGERVDIAGAVTLGATGAYTDILTIPAGFRLAGAFTNYFVGASVSSGGVGHQLFLSSTHKLQVPTGYRTGTMASGTVLPLDGSWYTN